MNPEIKEARSNVLKQGEEFEAQTIALAEAEGELSDEALEGIAGGCGDVNFNGPINGGSFNINQ